MDTVAKKFVLSPVVIHPHKSEPVWNELNFKKRIVTDNHKRFLILIITEQDNTNSHVMTNDVFVEFLNLSRSLLKGLSLGSLLLVL
jgi:hypothetical protein